MHLDVCLLCCNDYMLVGFNQAAPTMYLSLLVTCLSIFHAYVPSNFYILIYCLVGAFLIVPLSISLFLALVCSLAPKCKSTWSQNLFHLRHPLLLLTLYLLLHDFVMIKPEMTFQRTFLDESFIWNAKSSYRIFPILTYPLSSTVGVGGHCVTSRSLVPS